ncbi:chitin binding peritrophin-A domain-containing protein [Phthorimaea operculella]|nr:chitin binding peritrophin-A domain-containing protein [Phthorimaea operculella]
MNGLILTVLSIFALASGASVKSSAQDTCAAADSEGQLVEHQECAKFYECAGGVPVPFTCPDNLYYNDDKKICDHPENVDCGDRAVKDVAANDEPDSNEIISVSDAVADEVQVVNEAADKVKVQVADDAKNSVVSDDYKSYALKAAEACSAQDSDGVLLPHGDCDKFYECSRGVPFTLQCPQNPPLLYNPEYQFCDWASQVDCGDRKQ